MKIIINFVSRIPIRVKSLILFISFFTSCFLCAYGEFTADSLMKRLDAVIADRPLYLARKEKRLAELTEQFDKTSEPRERFDALIHLYDEYHSFNADSAYSISLRQETLARTIGDPVLIAHALMNRANIMSATGMYHETLEIIDSIPFESLPDYLHPYYYHIKRTVYGRLADFAAFGPEKQRYSDLTNMYRDSIIEANEPGSLAHVITKADMLNVKGDPEGAVRILNTFISANNLSEHERAICAWTLSESYGRMGDKGKQKEQLLISSISDMKSSVREYMSLRQLALLLYEEGDLNRAYEFMTIAGEDATLCNARQRIVELNDSYPKINAIYVNTVHAQKGSLERTIFIITVLSLVLIVTLVYMRKQMCKIAKARKEIEEAYARLNEVTEKLRESNERLSEANNAIAEISELKEVYIGRYMDQCLIYIEKLDSYRKTAGKLLGAGKLDDLRKLFKSSSLIDEELKMFYDQFDKTFLNLFPTFVDDFNRLLLPHEAIVPKKEGSLNTELRIFALIRLGISDSDRIAKFLRYSLTTIYNYRTKVRNKSLGDRNLLEKEVMKIGRSEHAQDHKEKGKVQGE